MGERRNWLKMKKSQSRKRKMEEMSKKAEWFWRMVFGGLVGRESLETCTYGEDNNKLNENEWKNC